MRWLTSFWRRLNLHLPGFLLVCLTLTLIWATWQSHRHWDLSSWNSATLTQASQDLVARIDGPLSITAFANPAPALRAHIEDVVNRYRAAKPDIHLTWVNPETEPDVAREAGISRSGELIIRQGEKGVLVPRATEAQISQALYRLLASTELTAVVLEGLGGRSHQGSGQTDWGYFSGKLGEMGIQWLPLNLQHTPRIPDNTTSITLGGTSLPLSESAVSALIDYHHQGGNLLITLDPGEVANIAPLLHALGITAQEGRITDPEGARLRNISNPAILALSSFTTHPVTQNLEQALLLPISCSLEINDLIHSPWMPLLQTENSSRITSDQNATGLSSLQASHLLAAVRPDDQQGGKVAVICDSDFLSNGFIANGDNLQFGLNLIHWINHRDPQLEIVRPERPDLILGITPRQAALLEGIFKLALPLGIMCVGIVFWQRRKKG
jgi:hypothetical protein